MARSSECTGKYARKELDSADIVRDGDFATVCGDFRAYFFRSENASGRTPMIPIFLPVYSKSKLLVLCFGSLLLLVGGLKAGHSGGNLQRRLLAPTGLAGLLYVLLELCWYFYIASSRGIAFAYYFGFRFWGGIVAGMFLYVIFRNAKVFMGVSAVLLVAFNVFVIARHLGGAMSLLGHADGLFGGMFTASLALLRLDQRQDQRRKMAPTTAANKP